MKVEDMQIQMPYRIGNKFMAGEWVNINDILEALDNAIDEIDQLNDVVDKLKENQYDEHQDIPQIHGKGISYWGGEWVRQLKTNGLLLASERRVTLEQTFQLYEVNKKYIAVGNNEKFQIRKEDK